MRNIVISLKNATERREHIINEFGKQGIDFEFFDAITPDLIEETCQKLGVNLTENQRLSNGEKACFLSHVCLWQKMLDENIEHLAIFEDDVCLGKSAHLFLNNNTWIQDIEFDVIKLETWKELVHLSKHGIDVFERQLKRLKSTHVGACGYIIKQSSAKIAIEYIKSLPTDYIFAIDHVIFGALLQDLTIYQMTPAFTIQTNLLDYKNLPSQLDDERKNNTFIYKNKGNIFIEVKKIFQRIYRSICKHTFYQIVPFQ